MARTKHERRVDEASSQLHIYLSMLNRELNILNEEGIKVSISYKPTANWGVEFIELTIHPEEDKHGNH